MEPEGSSPYSQEPASGLYLRQINPVHTTEFYLSNIHFNIMLQPTSRSS
jgi:hypothetical protein